MAEVSINHFMQLLRENKYYRMKQTPFLEYVVLYLNDGRCYQILFHAYPETLKNARKVGITNMFMKKPVYLDCVIVTPRGIIPPDGVSPVEFDIRKGKYLVRYSFKNNGGLEVFRGDL